MTARALPDLVVAVAGLRAGVPSSSAIAATPGRVVCALPRALFRRPMASARVMVGFRSTPIRRAGRRRG
jgi:hypothetical protein